MKKEKATMSQPYEPLNAPAQQLNDIVKSKSNRQEINQVRDQEHRAAAWQMRLSQCIIASQLWMVAGISGGVSVYDSPHVTCHVRSFAYTADLCIC